MISETEFQSVYYVKYRVPDWYRAIKGNKDKFLPREERYGIVSKYDDATKDAFKNNEVIVEDLITPDIIALKNDDGVEVVDFSAFDKVVEDYYNLHYNLAVKKAEVLPAGLQVGKFFSIGVADGQAHYIVTKVNKKTCTIEWRGWFNYDRYVDRHFGYEGKFSIEEIERWLPKMDRVRQPTLRSLMSLTS